MASNIFLCRAVWGGILILLTAFSTWELHNTQPLCYILPLGVLVALTWLASLGLAWSSRHLRIGAALVTLSHCLTIVIVGICRNRSGLSTFPCFPAAMQMIAIACASPPDHPIALHTVTALVAIVTAGVAFPSEFVHPIPLTFLVAALLLTFVSSMDALKLPVPAMITTTQVLPARSRNFSAIPDFLARCVRPANVLDCVEAEVMSASEAAEPHSAMSYPTTTSAINALSVEMHGFIDSCEAVRQTVLSPCDLKDSGLNRPQGASSASLPPSLPMPASSPAFPLCHVVVDKPVCQPHPLMHIPEFASKASEQSSSTPPLPTEFSSKSNEIRSSLQLPQSATPPSMPNSVFGESRHSSDATAPKSDSGSLGSLKASGLLSPPDEIVSPQENGSDEMKSPDVHSFRSPISVVQDVFALRYFELKELYDTEVVARKKADLGFAEEHHRANDMKSKCDNMETRMNAAVAEKAISDSHLKTEREGTAEMKVKYDALKVEFDEQDGIQKKAQADLIEQTNATAEMKVQLDEMTKLRDDEIILHEKTEQQLNSERKDTANMKSQFDYLKFKFDEQSDAQQKTQAELADQIGNAAEMKLQFDAVVKVRQDEVVLHEKTAQELVAQREQNSEMKLKYDSAHETMLEAVEGKRVADANFDRQSVVFQEVAGQMHTLNEAYQQSLADKGKADDDLRVEVQKNEAAKERFDSLKDAHDQNVALKVKAELALSEQCGKTKETQQLYSSLKTKYDKQKRQCSDQQESLVRASNQIKCLRWMLPDEAQAKVNGMPQFADPSLAAALQKPAQSDARSEVSAAPSSHEGHSAFQEAHSYHSSITNISDSVGVIARHNKITQYVIHVLVVNFFYVIPTRFPSQRYRNFFRFCWFGFYIKMNSTAKKLI